MKFDENTHHLDEVIINQSNTHHLDEVMINLGLIRSFYDG